MDDHATRLMNEAINVNYIDETEYPRVAVMCGRCLNILANLWNTPEKAQWKTGAPGIGSSEACMLGGVAAWLRWRNRRKAAGKPFDKPNLVMSSAYQVVWEKFCQLWQIELRTVPIDMQHPTLDIEAALRLCDENTICIVPIAGVTWSGLDDDIEGLDKALDAYNRRTGLEIPIHVDAASGGFILPFLHPERKWDFRLKWVLSISTSGHKFGLVYPGLGWVVWKDKKYLPDEMSFSVNYLGASITQVGLNFSRPAAQILGQYYNFIRLGFEGYREIQQNSMDIAAYCHREIGKMSCFRNFAPEVVNPLFIWSLDPEYEKRPNGLSSTCRPACSRAAGWCPPTRCRPTSSRRSSCASSCGRACRATWPTCCCRTSATPWRSSRSCSIPPPRGSSSSAANTRKARSTRTDVCRAAVGPGRMHPRGAHPSSFAPQPAITEVSEAETDNFGRERDLSVPEKA